MTKWSHTLPIDAPRSTPTRKFRGTFFIVILTFLAVFQFYLIGISFPTTFRDPAKIPFHAERSLARCASLKVSAGPSANFHDRTESDRFVHGTKATLLHNARIWTGGNNGTEIIHGDIFLDKAIIQGVGIVNLSRPDVDDLTARGELNVVDVHGAWVTPGCLSFNFFSTTIILILSISCRLVDPHSHLGDNASPALEGASLDYNSAKGTIQPWLRSLDGLNTHDDSYSLSIAGGVTTAIVLPGSGNAIGYLVFSVVPQFSAEPS